MINMRGGLHGMLHLASARNGQQQWPSRRAFLRCAAVAAAPFVARNDAADPLGLPVGLQLYTVGADMGKDFDGTLHRVAAIGYKQVEMAGFFGKTASQIRSALKANGRSEER